MQRTLSNTTRSLCSRFRSTRVVVERFSQRYGSTSAAVDLRSDTMTRPCDRMREAMRCAEVGDDVWGEDRTVQALEEKVADMFGKESGLFVPSGTMGNLVSVASHTERGDEIVLGDRSHIHLYEAGGVSVALSVTQKTLRTENDGRLKPEDVVAAVREDDPHFPRTSLVCLENTHNHCGGRVLSVKYTEEIGQICRERGLALHIDGARIWNASIATGESVASLAGQADSVSACLSKGLGAPVGSVVVGSTPFIEKCRRTRKMVGGGLRQSGILAAAGMVAIEENINRLADDHERAYRFATALASFDEIVLNATDVETNIVYFSIRPSSGIDGYALLDDLRSRGVLIGGGYNNGTGFRMVTHRDVSSADMDHAIAEFEKALVASARQERAKSLP